MKNFLLTSPSITLVPAAIGHAEALARLVRQNIAHLHAYLPAVAEVASLDRARNYLEAAAQGAREGDVLEWYLFSGDDLCGSIRVKEIDQHDRKAKIGYFLGSAFEGKGFMTASMRVILEYCFDTLDLHRIALHCASTNARSKAVATRLGFTLEGTLRQDEWLHGAFVDQHVYGLLRSEFKAAPA